MCILNLPNTYHRQRFTYLKMQSSFDAEINLSLRQANDESSKISELTRLQFSIARKLVRHFNFYCI